MLIKKWWSHYLARCGNTKSTLFTVLGHQRQRNEFFIVGKSTLTRVQAHMSFHFAPTALTSYNVKKKKYHLTLAAWINELRGSLVYVVSFCKCYEVNDVGLLTSTVSMTDVRSCENIGHALGISAGFNSLPSRHQFSCSGERPSCRTYLPGAQSKKLVSLFRLFTNVKETPVYWNKGIS